MKNLIFSTMAVTSMYATTAMSQQLTPECEHIDRNLLVLKYYGAPVSALTEPAVIPLKQQILEHCNLRNQKKLNQIQSIAVEGDSQSSQTAVWIETKNGKTRTKFLTLGDRDTRGDSVTIVKFNPDRFGDTTGRVQVFLRGELNLERIEVQFADTSDPEPIPEPIPQPRPDPIPEPIPQPIPEPIPEPAPVPTPTTRTTNVVCLSEPQQIQHCFVPGIISARLIQQLSLPHLPCLDGLSVAVFPGHSLAVSWGCKGIFEVTIQ